jgi:putative iron-only hydrogenase system regulator
MEESRLGMVSIVVEDLEISKEINAILHKYADIIVGRLGIPYRARGVAIIGVAVDGSMENISAMTGRLGKLPGVSVKTAVTRQENG